MSDTAWGFVRLLFWIGFLTWGYVGLWSLWTAGRSLKARYLAFALACFGSASNFGLRVRAVHPYVLNVWLALGIVAGLFLLVVVVVQQLRLRRLL